MAPSPWTWPAAWVELTAAVVLTAAYAVAALRFRPARWRLACFAGAIAILLAVSVTPLGTLALHYVLWAHLVQNVALAEWIPLLLVASVPPELAARAARIRGVRALTYPLVALPLWLGAYLVWHVPAAYEAALRHHALLHLEHLTYLTTGLLLWWPVLQSRPWSLSPGAKSAYLFAAFVFASPLGLLLALLPSPLYDFYVEAPRLAGLSPLADQQLAGIAMAVSESVVFFSLFTLYFVRFMAEEAAGAEGSPAAAPKSDGP
ncbi:MAG TPA: cytochrome c oxidase assembly protein [Gaiellaceae bacterium]|nr:cytochrome c oxidase assembly protein [Gaiellaceae bacterium]